MSTNRRALCCQSGLENLESLRKGATTSDAVIHLAFVHDFSKFQENCELDKNTIEALGAVLAGSDRPLIVRAGMAGLVAPEQDVTEETVIPPTRRARRVFQWLALRSARKINSQNREEILAHQRYGHAVIDPGAR